jgi:hypothetical protein
LETKAPWKLRKREREIPEDLTGGNGEEKLIDLELRKSGNQGGELGIWSERVPVFALKSRLLRV